MVREWNVDADGFRHQVSYSRSAWSGKETLLVDGSPVALPRPRGIKAMAGTDRSFMLGEREARLVIAGGKTDIALDGRYITDGRPYEPLPGMPRWAWVFWILNLCIVVIGGAIPAVCGFLGIVYCIRAAGAPGKSAKARVLRCVGITVLMLAIVLVTAVLVNLIFA